MAISKRITTFEVPFGTQSTTYLEGEMEGHCKIMYLFFYQLSSEPDREVILCISVLQNLEI